MRATLLILALLAALAGVVPWVAGGAPRGWTKTSVAVEKVDEITGIAYRVYEKKLVPGIEFPAVGIAAGAVLAAAGFLLARQGKW
mgnify:CR=1 FL=1